MAEYRKSELRDRLKNRQHSLCGHEKKFIDDVLALDQINLFNEFCGTSPISGGHEEKLIDDFLALDQINSFNEFCGTSPISGGITFVPEEYIFSSSSDSEVGGCKKLPKAITEEEIGPKTTAAPPRTTRKNQCSLTSPVCQAGSCDKLPKGIEEEKIVPKATAAPPVGRTTKRRSSGRKPRKMSSFLTAPVSQAGGCVKLPKGAEEEKIVPRATVAPKYASPPGTTTKSRSSGPKPKKISSFLTAPVSQSGGCEKLPKGIEEEEEIEPKAVAAPARRRRKGTTGNNDLKTVLGQKILNA